MKKEKDAYQEFVDLLQDDEAVELICFGNWGWSCGDANDELGYGEPESRPVPVNQRFRLLTFDEAEPFMHGWQFSGGFGAPNCYAFRAWTDKRVIFVGKYDGSTWLDWVPRHPSKEPPEMCGGG